MGKDIKIRDIDKLSYEDKVEGLKKLINTTTIDGELNSLLDQISQKIAEITVREEMAERMIDEDYSDKEIAYITRVSLSDVEKIRKRKNM
ncbi:MAG: hypothetical protein Q4E69_02430 [Bacilli bacterium]|nr:hypothetical protein [Bacilli bacterium]